MDWRDPGVMAGSMERLPIDDALPGLVHAIKTAGQAVLQAPPGAGKTTRVPLALLDASLCAGRIMMLEPRRLAARSAAERMAETLGEPVGQRIGYRVRGESKVSKSTRIEVVTEGILTRMIQSDPELNGVGAVIFDEFHERSLNADLGLALALEVRGALREDLVLLVMSATLDAAPVARLMGAAPIITSQGKSFDVETRWLQKPRGRRARFDRDMAELLRQAADETTGSILGFLPGEGEIRQVQGLLNGMAGIEVLPLFGSMPFAAQQKALKPSDGRRMVLATSIAETSLTIPDIRVVVDGGLSRRARFDPGSGMSRLVTERVTRAEADQRRGRAGRVAEGICYRLWTRGEEGALAAFPPAEIEAADLTGLALELAEWGTSDLPFLTAPPEGALSEARKLLSVLGAMEGGKITPHGKDLAHLPLHPRLAHMLKVSGQDAAMLAALLSDRDPLREAGCDLRTRLTALREAARSPALERIRAEAKRLARVAGETRVRDAGEQAMLAYPDRVGMRRPGGEARWLLSGGKGARMDEADALAGQRFLVVTDTDGHPTEARIRIGAAISEASIREILGDQIEHVRFAEWSRREGRVVARQEERLGAIALSSKRWSDVPDEWVSRAMLEGVRQMGFGFSKPCERFRSRVMLVRAQEHDLPDMGDTALIERLEDWLMPHISGVKSAAEWKAFDALPALRAMLNWDQMQLVDREAPAHFVTPLDRKIDIDYGGEMPAISLRLQEMFGVTRHPVVAGRPLQVTLLSPAARPVQTTMDIPGFWANSYADVRKDMRGRYPRHPWPEDPTEADPTLRAKRRPRG